MDPADQRRARMVERDIQGRGIADPRLLAAMRDVPREDFVADASRDEACADAPLPIGEGQTISQPYVVALMIDALRLRGSERVLEIGTGSGYSAAVLARMAAQVDSVERLPVLAERAARRLARLGLARLRVHCADGTLGWPAAAPFDAIVVTAAGPEVPAALLSQLAPGGRLVMPVGASLGGQELVRVTRLGADDWRRETLCEVAFVPLLGVQGWPVD